MSRKPSNFLARPLWHTLPYEGGDRDFSDALFDLMATLPFLLQEFDLLSGCAVTAEVHQRRIQLLYRCHELDRSLQQWYESLNAKVPKPLPSEIRPPAGKEDNSDSAQCFTFEDSDYALAISLALYWATCNILHGLIQTAHAYSLSSGFSEFAEELPSHVDPHRSATSIANSIEYFIRPQMGILGPQLISFPTGVALMYFMVSGDPNAEEERQGCTEIISRLSKVGTSIETFLGSLQAASRSTTPSSAAEDAWRGGAKTWFEGRPVWQPDLS
ncbi:MAG: hypothetical protein Q9219_004522 [cf. Caloplaca sp. 3 TL-2023]